MAEDPDEITELPPSGRENLVLGHQDSMQLDERDNVAAKQDELDKPVNELTRAMANLDPGRVTEKVSLVYFLSCLCFGRSG
jgi:hypothetical protein